MRMALYRGLPFLPFATSHAGSCLVDRRALPSARIDPAPHRGSSGDGTSNLGSLPLMLREDTLVSCHPIAEQAGK